MLHGGVTFLIRRVTALKLAFSLQHGLWHEYNSPDLAGLCLCVKQHQQLQRASYRLAVVSVRTGMRKMLSL